MAAFGFRSMGVTVRAEGGTRANLKAVARQLGRCGPDEPQADISILFVDRVRYDHESYVGKDVRWGGDVPMAVRQPGGWLELRFDELAARQTWVRCENSVVSIPMIRPLVRLAAVRKGLLPVHGTAVDLNHRGVIATGWSGAGKTGLLLSAVEAGARPISAENACIDEKGTLIPSTETLQIRPWHLANLTPAKWRALSRSRRSKLLFIDAALRCTRSFDHGVVARLRDAARRRNTIEIEVPQPLGQEAAPRVDNIIFLARTSAGAVAVTSVPDKVAIERLRLLFEEDLSELARYYRRYCYLRGVPALALDRYLDQYSHLLNQLTGTVRYHDAHTGRTHGELLRVLHHVDAFTEHRTVTA